MAGSRRAAAGFGGLFFLALHCLQLLLLEAKSAKSASGERLAATYQDIPSGTYSIWQIPPSPAAVLFLAHGHGHQRAEDFWDPSPDCAICSSLPEERLVVQAAMARRYAVISIQASGWGWGLSLDPETNPNLCTVCQFLRSWMEEHQLEHLPLTALGFSLGAMFVSVLGTQLELRGILLMGYYAFDGAVEAAEPPSYPPSLFIYMPKDSSSAEKLLGQMQVLAGKGIAVQSIACDPVPINATYFTERIPGLGGDVSASVHKALLAGNYLDPEGFLTVPAPVGWDAYSSWEWNIFAESLLVAQDISYLRWVREVGEELSLAYAFHVFTSLHTTQMLDWLDSTWNPVTQQQLTLPLYRGFLK